MSTENLSVAIASLQEAQKVLEAEHKHIEEHNIDVEAHPDIRELIDKIFDGEAVYSNSQIRAIIHDLLDQHSAINFKAAHTGWDEYNTALENRLATIEDKLTELDNVVRGQEEAKTDLNAQLAAIEARYANILDRLQGAMQQAQLAGDTDLANSYRDTIAKELDNKAKELLDCMRAWQTEHS